MFDVELHFLGFLGSLAIALFLLKDYIKGTLANNNTLGKRKFIRAKLALVAINVVIAQIIITVQEYGVDFYAAIRGDLYFVNLYIDHAEIISFSVGVFSATVFGLFVKSVKSKLG